MIEIPDEHIILISDCQARVTKMKGAAGSLHAENVARRGEKSELRMFDLEVNIVLIRRSANTPSTALALRE